MIKLPDFKEERKLWKQDYGLVIGVDEVGRGAFAGPLVAGAVAFAVATGHPSQILNLGINDSKLLKPNKRKALTKEIKKNCLAYGIGEVGVRTINKLGISKATAMAMRKAVNSLWHMAYGNRNYTLNAIRYKPYILVDAFHIKYLRGIGLKNQKAIRKGDQKSISIAAASILAKVYRDSLMRKFTKRYRKYHWGANKGYGTKKHQQAILQNGLTSLHRKQFVETFLEHYLSI